MFREIVLFGSVVCFLPVFGIWVLLSFSAVSSIFDGAFEFDRAVLLVWALVLGGGVGLTGAIKLMHRFLYPETNSSNPKTVKMFVVVGLFCLIPAGVFIFPYGALPLFAIAYLAYLERDFLWKDS